MIQKIAVILPTCLALALVPLIIGGCRTQKIERHFADELPIIIVNTSGTASDETTLHFTCLNREDCPPALETGGEFGSPNNPAMDRETNLHLPFYGRSDIYYVDSEQRSARHIETDLESITSEFVFEPDSIDAVAAILSGQLKIEPDAKVSVLPGDRLSLQVTEKVTLRGKYRTSPEKFPMIQAARWALARTDNETVKEELNEYIRLAVEDVSESSEEGFESVFVLRHSLVMVKSQSGIQIAQDSFTNRSIDDPGTDSVVWRDGEYIRNKPDLTEWPDHRMYTIPIEEPGRKMLDLYTDIYTDENSTLEFDD